MKRHIVFAALVLLCLLSTLQRTLRAAENISQWHLPDGAVARLGKGPVNQIAYSPDGKHLAVVSDIGVWIYDASTGAEQALLTRDTGRAVSNVVFSPDGQILAVTGDRQELQLWDTRTWTLNGTFDKNKSGWPSQCTFSPDGNTIAVADLGQTTELWDVSTIRFKLTLEDSADPYSEGTGLFSIVYSPNGDTVAIGSNGTGTVRLWDTSTGTLKHTFIGEITSRESFSFSPDGNALATRSFTNTVSLWDTTAGRHKRMLEGLGNDLGDTIAYSPDGKILAIPCWDGLQLWDAEIGEHKRTLEHSGTIENFSFSPDGNTIAGIYAHQRKVWHDEDKTSYSPSIYHTVSLWDTATQKRRDTLETTDSVESIAFNPDGDTIATSNADNTVQVWDVGTGELKYTLEHTGGIVGISYNLERPDIFITAHTDKTTRVWDTRTQTRKHTFRLTEHTDAVNSAAFSADGNTLATGSADGSVQLWDATTGILKETLMGRRYTDDSPVVGPFSVDGDTLVVNLGGAVQLLGMAPARVKQMIRTRKYTADANGLNLTWVRSIAYSPDGNTIATGMDENTVMVWDIRTEERKHTFEHFDEYRSEVHGVAFSPDGSTLATANINKILLWDTSTWALKKHTLDIDSCYTYYTDISISALMYSPDGNTLAHGCSGTLLWNPLTGALKNRLAGHAGTVTSVTYHPDGNILATAGQDGTVLLWDLTSHDLNSK